MNFKVVRNEEGVVMVIVMIILAATILLGLAALTIGATDVAIARTYGNNVTSFYASEAGIERAIAQMTLDRTWVEGYDFSPDTTLANGARYDVDIANAGGNLRKILSTGKFGTSERILEVVVNMDSAFNHALNVGGDIILKGKPRFSEEGIRGNSNIYLELESGTPQLNVYSTDPENLVTVEGDGRNVSLHETEAMDLESLRLELTEWESLAAQASDSYYYDTDGLFNTRDTDMSFNNFDCNTVDANDSGQRTLFVDGTVTFHGGLGGTCTVVATGKIVGTDGFVTGAGTTVSMVAMDDVLLNFDTDAQSALNGLVYTESDYELHGKVKFNGIITAFGNLSIQNPSEFTQNSDSNYWYTYSSAYALLADPLDRISWYERYRQG